MSADTSAVDAALVTYLSSDPALTSTMPDGVFWDLAPQGSTRFVLVSQHAHEDTNAFQDVAFEHIVYLVKAVSRDVSGDDVKTAAARIHALLQNGSIAPAGYGLMAMQRMERIRYTEVDEDKDVRWQHRGGLYEVYVDPQ